MDKFVNKKPAYKSTNTHLYLSFVHNQDEGTWICGDQPGVDSGTMFARVPRPTFTPFDAAGGWQAWQGKKWAPQLDMRLECLDEPKALSWGSVDYVNPNNEIEQYMIVSGLENSEDCSSAGDCPYMYDMNLVRFGDKDEMSVSEFKVSLSLPFGSRLTFGQDDLLFRNIEWLNSDWRLAMYDSSNGEDRYFMTSRQGLLQDGKQINPTPTIKEIDWDQFSLLQINDYAMLYTDADEFMGKVMRKFESQVVFRVWPSHRRHLMEETVLHAITSTITVDYKAKTIIQGAESSLTLHTLEILGDDLLAYLERHISLNEGLWDLSSCFTYHAATALPEQLVYALELVCFVMGYKPVVMVQMTSKSDEQSKFPFVEELLQALVLYSRFENNVFYRINRYRHAETLIFYKEETKYLAELLTPFGEAQALHIVPFPGENKEENKPIYEEQIRNSYFNGVVLGYPERFVESYSRDLVKEDLLDGRSIEWNIRRGARQAQEAPFEKRPIGKGASTNDYSEFRNFFLTFQPSKAEVRSSSTRMHDEL